MNYARRRRRYVTLAAVLLFVSGCGSPAGNGIPACTEIGAPDGVSVTVAAERSSTVRRIDLQVCWEAACDNPDLVLRDGSTTTDQGCNADGLCSASSRPNGTLVGFALVPNLPAGKVEISAAITDSSGRAKILQPISARASTVYPNGEQCPGQGQQLGLTLDNSGLHAS